jgi:hypothetical protein
LEEFDRAGDLTALAPAQLLHLTTLIADAHEICRDILQEHERNSPSTAWFAISTVSGFGGLVLLEPTLGAIVITLGGIAGAAKSLYDYGAHLVVEQRYLDLYWRTEARKDALKIELIRRGIR